MRVFAPVLALLFVTVNKGANMTQATIITKIEITWNSSNVIKDAVRANYESDHDLI